VARETTPTEDLLLQLPPSINFPSTYITYPLPGERDNLTDADLPSIVQTLQIEYEQRQIEQNKYEQEKQERKEKEVQEMLPKVRTGIQEILDNPLPVSDLDNIAVKRSSFASCRGLNVSTAAEAVKDSIDPAVWSAFRDKLRANDEYWMRWQADQECNQTREKEAKQAAQKAFITQWASEHGSERLRSQVELGYNARSLFLQEKIALDFPGCRMELDNAADGYDVVHNPELDDLQTEVEVIKVLVQLGLVTAESAHEMTKIAYTTEEDEESGESERKYYLVIEGYYPGPKDIFDSYTLAMEI
jgi:hypothetical protein